MLSFLLLLVIVITSLPVLRRKSYNTFYYAHVICSAFIFILASIHCSTDFYFLLPGLLLWAGDWVWRLFRGDTGLKTKVECKLELADGDWCRLTLPPAVRYSNASSDGSEKNTEVSHPLQTYYVNIPSVSKLQNHAFTAAKIGNPGTGPVILFQRSQIGVDKRKPKRLQKEWTWKVQDTLQRNDSQRSQACDIEVRVEGPYVPSETQQFRDANVVVCIVGGTGLTGAYSLAEWWLKYRAQHTRDRFVLVWTIRNRATAELSEWLDLQQRTSDETSNIHLVLHVSSEQGRLDVATSLREHLRDAASTTSMAAQENSHIDEQHAWVYVSGPVGLLDQAEDACVDLERQIRRQKRKKDRGNPDPAVGVDRLEHYIAKWEV
jgi:ferric-chelate reductase